MPSQEYKKPPRRRKGNKHDENAGQPQDDPRLSEKDALAVALLSAATETLLAEIDNVLRKMR